MSQHFKLHFYFPDCKYWWYNQIIHGIFDMLVQESFKARIIVVQETERILKVSTYYNKKYDSERTTLISIKRSD